MSNSLKPQGLQHSRLPCPSLSPGVCSKSCLLSQWCYLNISPSATPSSSCPQSFPASGSFPVSKFFTSGGQNIGTSASVLPMNIQGWLPLQLTDLILQSKGFSRVFSSTPFWKHQLLVLDGPRLKVQFSTILDYWKTIAWQYRPLLAKWCLCFLICCLGLS